MLSSLAHDVGAAQWLSPEVSAVTPRPASA
jgi:hypothetical protein